MFIGLTGLLFYFKPIPAITSYHHFNLSKSHCGVVKVKEYNSVEEENIFRKSINASSLRGKRPTEIHPKGLDDAQQWYL